MSGRSRKKRAPEGGLTARAGALGPRGLGRVGVRSQMALTRGHGAKLGNRPLWCSRGAHGTRSGRPLVAQSEVLQGDLTVTAAQHREESKQVEKESNH